MDFTAVISLLAFAVGSSTGAAAIALRVEHRLTALEEGLRYLARDMRVLMNEANLNQED